MRVGAVSDSDQAAASENTTVIKTLASALTNKEWVYVRNLLHYGGVARLPEFLVGLSHHPLTYLPRLYVLKSQTRVYVADLAFGACYRNCAGPGVSGSRYRRQTGHGACLELPSTLNQLTCMHSMRICTNMPCAYACTRSTCTQTLIDHGDRLSALRP